MLLHDIPKEITLTEEQKLRMWGVNGLHPRHNTFMVRPDGTVWLYEFMPPDIRHWGNMSIGDTWLRRGRNRVLGGEHIDLTLLYINYGDNVVDPPPNIGPEY